MPPVDADVFELAVERMADWLEAPWGGPTDAIICQDCDALRDLDMRTRRRIVRAAKGLCVRREVEERCGPEALFYLSEYEPCILEELDSGQRREAIERERSMIFENIEHLRKHSQLDCFEKDYVRQVNRIIAELWPRHDCGTVVYIIGPPNQDIVKIGTTTNLKSRLRSLRTAMPSEPVVYLTLPGSSALERELHLRFAADKIGREWFRRSPDIDNFIESKTATH